MVGYFPALSEITRVIMVRDIIDHLKNIIADKYTDQVSDMNFPEEEQKIVHLFNQVVADLRKAKSKSFSLKANLLTDIDILAEVQENLPRQF